MIVVVFYSNLLSESTHMPIDRDGIEANEACHVINCLRANTIYALNSVTELFGRQMGPQIFNVFNLTLIQESD